MNATKSEMPLDPWWEGVRAVRRRDRGKEGLEEV